MRPPAFVEAFEQATRAHQAGQLERAAQLYRTVLAQAPRHAEAHHRLGLICSQQGDQEQAVKHLRQAVALNDNNPLYHNNLGEALRRQGQDQPAIAAYRRALALAPDLAEAHYNLANMLKQTGQVEQAIQHYQRALQLKPAYPSALYNLGNALLELGQLRAAAQAYQQALALNPQFALAYNNLGVVLREQERLDEAIAHYRQAIQLKPDLADAHSNLSQALERQGQIEAAAQAGRQALALDPANDLLALHVDTICPPIPASSPAIDDYRARLLETIERYRRQGMRVDLSRLHMAGGEPPFVLAYQGRDERELKQRYAALFEGSFPQEPQPPGGGKPHIGIVVTHGHEGVFLKCMRGIINHLPGERLRITLVCGRKLGEQLLRPACANPAVGYLSLPERFDHAVALLRQARFDLLHYWEVGSDATNYFLPFCRLAPLQSTSWGWPVTSGIPAMDYFLSSALLEPEDGDQHYSERLVRFAHLPTYYYRPPLPSRLLPRSHFGLPEQAHLYLCAQNLRKFHPDFDELLAGILRQDQRGLLLCIEDQQPQITVLLRERLRLHMPDVAERVRFLPRMDEQQYLNLTALADVGLDTLHYGGGANTCYDSFAAGTPLVTLPTRFHRGRYAYAAYRAMGLEECIAQTPESYVEIALRLGGDRAYRQELSARITAACPMLFEDRAAVEELASFFERAVETYTATPASAIPASAG